MASYKLIKEYPGCGIPVGAEIYPHPTIFGYFKELKTSLVFHQSTVINYPEFWEKTEEQTWFGLNPTTWNKVDDKSSWEKDHAYCGGYWIWFKTKNERDSYVEENKPRFSKNDMIDFALYSRGFVGEMSTIDCYNNWWNKNKK